MTSLHLSADLDSRTVFRPPTLADADALFRQVDANRAYLSRWLGWVDGCRSPEDARDFVHRVEEMHRQHSSLTNVIVHRGELVGVVSIHAIDWMHLNAGIGYWVAESHQGRGLVTRAVEAVLEYMFQELSLHRAEIRCAPQNVRSRELALRLGFTYEGTVREAGRVEADRYVDLMMFSLLEQEWRERV